MGQTLGKQFEQKFYDDFLKIESSSIDRNYDIMLGYKHISSISDYTCYIYPNLYYIECKTIKGNTFPISNLTQLDKLKEKIGIKGIRAGVIIWFYEHENKIIYVPAKTCSPVSFSEINADFQDNLPSNTSAISFLLVSKCNT